MDPGISIGLPARTPYGAPALSNPLLQGPFCVAAPLPRVFATTDYEDGLRKEFCLLLEEHGITSKSEKRFLIDTLELMFDLHRGQKRNNGVTPYCQHPFDVCKIAIRSGVSDANALAAYLLHDTAEEFGKERGLDELTRWRDGLAYLAEHPLLQGARSEVFQIVDIMTLKQLSTAHAREERKSEDRQAYLAQYGGEGDAVNKAWLGKHFDMLANTADLHTFEVSRRERTVAKYKYYLDTLRDVRAEGLPDFGVNIRLLTTTLRGVLDGRSFDGVKS